MPKHFRPPLSPILLRPHPGQQAAAAYNPAMLETPDNHVDQPAATVERLPRRYHPSLDARPAIRDVFARTPKQNGSPDNVMTAVIEGYTEDLND
jgi:hypothetical protein